MEEESIRKDEDKKRKGSSLKKPSVGGDLLSLMIEAGRITKTAASVKLGVDLKTINDWVNTLEKEGWVKVTDRELEDSILEVKESALREFMDAEKELFGKEKDVVKGEQQKVRLGERIKNLLGKVLNFTTRSKMDFAMILAATFSFYLIKRFVSDPDQEALSFLIAMVVFSVMIVIYHKYEKVLKTRGVIVFAASLMEAMVQKRRSILSVLISIVFVGSVGAFLFGPGHSIYSLLLCVILLSTIILLYQPKKTMGEMLGFYLGMVLLTCSILLIIGMLGVSMIIFGAGNESHMIDIAVALAIMVVLQLNEDSLGVGVKSFQKMIPEPKKKSRF